MFRIGSLRSLLTEIIELKTLMYKGLNNDVYKHINPGQDRVYVRKIKELIDTYLWIKNIKKQESKIGKCPHINECLSANKTLTIDCDNIDNREDYWCFSKLLPKLGTKDEFESLYEEIIQILFKKLQPKNYFLEFRPKLDKLKSIYNDLLEHEKVYQNYIKALEEKRIETVVKHQKLKTEILQLKQVNEKLALEIVDYNEIMNKQREKIERIIQLENRIREEEGENRELHNEIVLFKNEKQNVFFVVPDCEFYKEDGTCKRCLNNKKYGCNELYCEQKIKRKAVDPNDAKI